MSMNVKLTMVVVVRFAQTLKEALNVLVERAIYYMMMEDNVQVPKQYTLRLYCSQYGTTHELIHTCVNALMHEQILFLH